MIIHNPILTGSLTLNNVNLSTGNLVTTGSNTFVGNQILSGSLTVSGSVSATGTLTAQTLVVQTVTSSVLYSSGSNIFGNNIANTQTFTGSVLITGSVGIGISPYYPLTVYGSGTANSIMTETAATFGKTNGITIGSDGTHALIGAQNSSSDIILLKRVAGVFSEAMRITSGGNVGIGTSTLLDAGLTIETNSNSFNALALRDSRAFSTIPEVALAFRVKYNSAGAYATPALLVAFKDNATDGNQAGSLAFFTNANSGPTERMRIASNGVVNFVNGITFSGGSTLSTYSEGTYTPTVDQAGSNLTINTIRTAYYKQIGNLVNVMGGFNVTVTATGKRNMVFRAPINFNNSTQPVGFCSIYDLGSGHSNSGILIRNTAGNAYQLYMEANFTSTGTTDMTFNITYHT
jgi:hypothetical protein